MNRLGLYRLPEVTQERLWILRNDVLPVSKPGRWFRRADREQTGIHFLISGPCLTLGSSQYTHGTSASLPVSCRTWREATGGSF